MDIGPSIRGARTRARLTQAELARRSGTSQATLSAYETGRKKPSVATLSRILEAAGAELTVRPGPLRRNGHALEQVLALAEQMPTRHAAELQFPRLVA